MRSLSCAFWPARASRRFSNRWRSPLDQAGKLRFVEAAVQGRRKGDLLHSVPLRLEPALARGELVQAFGHHGQIGPRHRLVEADHDVAGPDAVAVAGEDLADDAAGRVLDLLDVAVDHDGAGRDDRAGQFRHRRPAAEADRRGRERRTAQAAYGGGSSCGHSGVFGLHDATPRSSTTFSE